MELTASIKINLDDVFSIRKESDRTLITYCDGSIRSFKKEFSISFDDNNFIKIEKENFTLFINPVNLYKIKYIFKIQDDYTFNENGSSFHIYYALVLKKDETEDNYLIEDYNYLEEDSSKNRSFYRTRIDYETYEDKEKSKIVLVYGSSEVSIQSIVFDILLEQDIMYNILDYETKNEEISGPILYLKLNFWGINDETSN